MVERCEGWESNGALESENYGDERSGVHFQHVKTASFLTN